MSSSIPGEEPHAGIVASISSGQTAIVTCVEDERLEFQVIHAHSLGCQDLVAGRRCSTPVSASHTNLLSLPNICSSLGW